MKGPSDKISVFLVSGNATTSVSLIARSIAPSLIARSTDPDFVRHVIATFRENRLLEADAEDVICDLDFLAKAEPMMACLARRIRRNAASLPSDLPSDSSQS